MVNKIHRYIVSLIEIHSLYISEKCHQFRYIGLGDMLFSKCAA